jgi:hypothetical protein
LSDHEQSAVRSRRRDVRQHTAVRDKSAAENGGARLTVDQILAWADAHHAAHGAWPDGRAGSPFSAVEGVAGESWQAINVALAIGLRGLPGDSSLGELLAEQRGTPAPDPRALGEKIWAWEQEHFPIKRPRVRPRGRAVRRPLTISQILAWADAHHAATGRWPNRRSGDVIAASGERWKTIDGVLWSGRRGLPGGQSLARLLAEQRGAHNIHTVKRLTIAQILAWADAHHAVHGCWPNLDSGPIDGVPRETWAAVNIALRNGNRGLEAGVSLARLLIEHRGPEAHNRPPRMTMDQVLAWADAHQAATGRWPNSYSGPIGEATGETWCAVDLALRRGMRGLPGGTSLTNLLVQLRGHRNKAAAPPLTHAQILAWADAYHAAHGRWPTVRSGPVADAPGETWRGVTIALNNGGRGLSRGTTLPRLLERHRGRRNHLNRPKLSLEQVRTWAETHRAATGNWPHVGSGPVIGAPDETWRAIVVAMYQGSRGLRGGLSLSRFLRQGCTAARPGWKSRRERRS